MEELHPVDRFEFLEVDVLVDCLVLDGLLVLVEFDVPLLNVARVALGVRTPVCHAEAGMGESGVSAEDDHAEHACC